jgi:gliomedin
MIGKPLLHSHPGIVWGAWMKDPLAQPDKAGHIWVTRHHTGNVLTEYESLEELDRDNALTVYDLSDPYFGTGHVVYDESLFYHRSGQSEIIKFDLKQRRITARIYIPEAAYHDNNNLYSTENGYFDLAADENGLWVIYAMVSQPNLTFVSKLNPLNLSLEKTWDIPANHQDYGNGLIVCGVLYLVRDTRSKNTVIDFAYDLYLGEKLSVRLRLTNPFQMNNMVAYNANEKKIYGWDNGNLLTYSILI